ncbi:MAG TPA: RHS repeat-associated core domain-containing protein, partial [Polyangiaceae bacterium]
RLITATDSVLGVTSYTLDPAGKTTAVTYPNGVGSTLGYDAVGRVTSIATNGAGATPAPIASYGYKLDPAGNRLSAAELSGRTVTWGYDSVYRLTSEAVTGTDPSQATGVQYGYDSVGNRLNRTSTLAGVPTVASTFDSDDRLGSDGYDANGQTTSSGGDTYDYDFAGRLTARTGTGVALAYDGVGHRVSKTVGGTTTHYLVADVNPTGVPQVAEEIVGGVVQRAYTFGPALIGQRTLAGGAWQAAFYGLDAQGSVRFLTDAGGAVTDTYDYDAFGLLLGGAGSTSNSRRYAGEEYDADLELLNLRARYLSPRTGRFFTQDPAPGNTAHPATLNKYAYAWNDPVGRTDPTGLAPSDDRRDFGYAVEACVQPIYLRDHIGDFVIFGQLMPSYEMKPGKETTKIKPDIQNYRDGLNANKLWGDIKPLSVSGLISAARSYAKYTAALNDDWSPDIGWVPSNPIIFPENVVTYISNVGGIVFYTRIETIFELLVVSDSLAALAEALASNPGVVVPSVASETAGSFEGAVMFAENAGEAEIESDVAADTEAAIATEGL